MKKEKLKKITVKHAYCDGGQEFEAEVRLGSVPLLYDILNSSAYADLKPSAAKGLPLFLAKVKWLGKEEKEIRGLFNESFKLTYTEAKRHGISSGTFDDSVIPDLVAKGFIVVVERGKRSGNLYKLSWGWVFYGGGLKAAAKKRVEFAEEERDKIPF